MVHSADFESNGKDIGPYEFEYPLHNFGAIGEITSSWAARLSRGQTGCSQPEYPEAERPSASVKHIDHDWSKSQTFLNAPHPHGVPTPQWLYHPDPNFQLAPGVPEGVQPQVLSYCVPVIFNGHWLYLPVTRVDNQQFHFCRQEPIC